MKLTGMIHTVEHDCLLSIIIGNKKQYFYYSRHLQKTFNKYLRKGRIVSLRCNEKKKRIKGVKAYPVTSITSIYGPNRKKIKEFFSLGTIKKGIEEIIIKEENSLFLDFEMNMQDYVSIEGFFQEIIEVGYYLMDSQDKIIKKDHFYVKPTLFPELTKRTMKFLKYPPNVMDNAYDFATFHFLFEEIIKTYNPRIFVWGKSDIKTMQASFEINKLRPFPKAFIDLLKLHTTYFNYKEQPGLFRMWETYYNTELPEQKHNALVDAKILSEIYMGFKTFIKKGE